MAMDLSKKKVAVLWAGKLGGMLVQAIFASDFPVVKAMTFFGTLLYIVFNLVSDILYATADPRIKIGGD